VRFEAARRAGCIDLKGAITGKPEGYRSSCDPALLFT
jgi:hypothetical protein